MPILSDKPQSLSQVDPDLLSKIQDLELKQVITKSQDNTKGFYSRVFTVPKPGKEERRFIFDLRNLNKCLRIQKFKMERLQDALTLIARGDWITSIDISEAYHHVPIRPDHQKYLRFAIRCPDGTTQSYEFRSLPMGLAISPRVFTKVMKVPVELMRVQRVRVAIYMDDMLIISKSMEQCNHDTKVALDILDQAGFVVNSEKSELQPKQLIKFLGMMIDTKEMTISVPKSKVDKSTKLLRQCRQEVKENLLTARQLARLIGVIGSLHHAIPDTRLRLVHLQRAKTAALRKGNWLSIAYLNPEALKELEFWEASIEFLSSKGRRFNLLPANYTINTDASDVGFGAAVTEGLSPEQLALKRHRIQSPWDAQQEQAHINWKELYAATQALVHFASLYNWRQTRIRIRSDNTVTIAYLNKVGGRIPYLNELMIQLYEFCDQRQLQLEATYIQGLLNTVADRLSRDIPQDFSEAMLHSACMDQINQRFGQRTLDLFASSRNNRTQKFVSLHPDQEAVATDAFTINWGQTREALYINPPFILLPRVLQKLRADQARAVLIAPLWTTAMWWPCLIEVMVDLPLVFDSTQAVVLPQEEPKPGGFQYENIQNDPLWMVGAWSISGITRETEAFRERLRDSSPFLNAERLVRLTTVPGVASPDSSRRTVSRFDALLSSLMSKTL